MSIAFFFIKLSQASVLFPIFTGLLYYKKLKKSYKILFFFFVIALLFEIQATLFKFIFHNNMPGLHLYTFIEFIVFSIVFNFYFAKNRLISNIIKINAFVFVIIAFVNAFIVNDFWHPNTISRTYSSILLIVYSLFYFSSLFKNDMESYSWQYPMFWVSTGVLVYFAINLFYFLLNSYLIENAAQTARFSLFAHATVNIIANCIFAQSFLCFKNTKIKL